MGKHGHQAPLEPAPKGLLLAIPVRAVGKRRLVHDAQAKQPLPSLMGEHGRSIIGQERSRQPPLVEGLGQSVDEVLSRLGEVPLNVAAEARAVIEDTEHPGRVPDAIGIHHAFRALMEIKMPQSMIVLRLETPDFPFFQALRRPHLTLSPRQS